MRIVLDLQVCQSQARFHGIGRYSLELSKEIVKQLDGHEIVLLLNDLYPESIPYLHAQFEGLLPPEAIHVMSLPGAIAEYDSGASVRACAAEKLREAYIEALNPDVVHVFSMMEGWGSNVASSIGVYAGNYTSLVTVYDFIPLVLRNDYLHDEAMAKHYMRKIGMMEKADHYFAISYFTKTEILKYLNRNEEDITTIECAVDQSFRVVDISHITKMDLFMRLGISGPFILYAPSGFDSRKNVEGLLKAFSLLDADIINRYQLVIPGNVSKEKKSEFLSYLEKDRIDLSRINFTGYVSDQDLVYLYNLCDVFVFPSLYEGFGLPVLEAMACGAPTIGSDRSSIPEVIGREDALFDPESPTDMAKKIEQVIFDKKFNDSLRNYGVERAKYFSWAKAAEDTIEVYKSIFGRRKAENHSRGVFDNDALRNALVDCIGAEEYSINDLVKISASLVNNHCLLSEQKQILLDISVLVKEDARSGIQRVVRSILLELLGRSPNGYSVRPVYYMQGRFHYANRFSNNISGEDIFPDKDQEIVFSRNDIYLSLDLNFDVAEITRDILFRMKNYGVELYFIVYDILLVHHPEWWPDGSSQVFVNWLKCVAEISTGLACISKTVSKDVRQWIENNPPARLQEPEIMVFNLGADIENSIPSSLRTGEDLALMDKLKERISFLMVGTIEPRKGHIYVLDTFEKIWESGLDVNLVIVGKEGWLMSAFIDRLKTHNQLGKHLFWFPGVSDEYLLQIYKNSACLIAASEGEGYGLPLIEAAQHEIPIIARDIEVFKEVAGDYAVYFDSARGDALYDAINDWINDYAKGQVKETKGMPWVNWHESANQLLSQILKNAGH